MKCVFFRFLGPRLSSAYVRRSVKGLTFSPHSQQGGYSHLKAALTTSLFNQALFFFDDARLECEEGLIPTLEKNDSRSQDVLLDDFLGRKKMMYICRSVM
ncbi:hypothetical protein AVEN_91308-1 [Araneus ventricosus]|uniref:Uncharacterized protein n=1 Tax=Araneus ventricosus TaxID=182803 RepID=A0A4Y2ES35_ARAVE|nr:hypothetical protein AVEN_91308-1 [Araneus ventricosus]